MAIPTENFLRHLWEINQGRDNAEFSHYNSLMKEPRFSTVKVPLKLAGQGKISLLTGPTFVIHPPQYK